MREYRYHVDREGRVFHDGTEIVDPVVLRFFVRAMTRTDDGRYLVVCQGERNWFESEDTPLVVQRLVLATADGAHAGIELVFAGDVREPLDCATLEYERDRVFCRVRGGKLRARLGRIAMQQLAPFIDADAGMPVLAVGRDRYPIREVACAGGIVGVLRP